MSRIRLEDRGREDRKVFHTHWTFLVKRLTACALPLAVSIFLAVLVGSRFWPVWILPIISLGVIVWVVVDWRRRVFVFHNGRLHKPEGWLHLRQRVLNFSFGQWTFVQSFLGKLMDYGDVEIGTGSGTDSLECVEHFSAFVEALETMRQQQAAAQQTPPSQVQQQAVVFMMLTSEDGTEMPEAWRRTSVDRDITRDGGYIYQGIPFDVDVPSYPGFLAFCDEFVLRQRNWSTWCCISADPGRCYYPHGIGSHTAQFYLELLARARIIRGSHNGDNGWVSSRIRTLEDIKLRVPYFERFQPTNQ